MNDNDTEETIKVTGTTMKETEEVFKRIRKEIG